MTRRVIKKDIRHAPRLSKVIKKPVPLLSEQSNGKKRCKLYELPQKQAIEVHCGDVVLSFDHLDGMYSYCTVKEGKSAGKLFHLSANTPLVQKNYWGRIYYEVEM